MCFDAGADGASAGELEYFFEIGASSEIAAPYGHASEHGVDQRELELAYRETHQHQWPGPFQGAKSLWNGRRRGSEHDGGVRGPFRHRFGAASASQFQLVLRYVRHRYTEPAAPRDLQGKLSEPSEAEQRHGLAWRKPRLAQGAVSRPSGAA